MKRKTKIAAVCTTAAVLAMGATITSFAAWERSGEDWIFTDSSGNRVTNSWRESGSQMFYLRSDGIMARSQWIDGTYYVSSSGARAANRWVYAEEGTREAPNGGGGWFYLDANGRVAVDGWRTINEKRYHFDYDGVMDYGIYIDDNNNMYYLGDEDDGAMKTGWVALAYDEDEYPEDGEMPMEAANGYSGTWFYFQENGRAVRAGEGETYQDRSINGSRYYFDEYGRMATGWTVVEDREPGDRTGISTLKYFGDENDGRMARGWKYLMESPEEASDDFSFELATSSNASYYNNWDGDGVWYYFDNNGVPAYLESSADSLSDATVRINSQYYFFDEYGRMQSGLLGFVTEDGSVLSAYFGADDSDGAMKRERQTNVYDEEGERGTYYFNNSGINRGAGYTGERNGYLYYNGKLVQAEEGEDLQVFEAGGRLYLVNENGRVQDSNRFYRVDGEYRYEYDDGAIYYVNSNRERISEVTRGARLPEIAYRAIYVL